MLTEVPKIIVFASGTKDGGGSGFEDLVYKSKTGELKAEVTAVVSNWPSGGVYQRALKLGVPFEHFKKPFNLETYRSYISKYNAKYTILCGWLKLVPMAQPTTAKDGLDPTTTINIHPGPLPEFGGHGMFGLNVHKKVIEEYKKGQIKCSGVTIHYVTDIYDDGPKIYFKPVPIEANDTPETLSSRVNKVEHEIYSKAINLVVNGDISWDGNDPNSLITTHNIEDK